MNTSQKYNEKDFFRTNKLKTLQNAWINCFAEKYERTHNISELPSIDSNTTMSDAKNSTSQIKLWWRLMSYRGHWKIAFAELKDYSWEIQLAFSKSNLLLDIWDSNNLDNIVIWDEELDIYKFIEKYIDVWDIIWVEWDLFYTQKWELTLLVKNFVLLTKTINSLPEKFHWITDAEEKFRKRYLDILINKDVKETVERRSMYFRAIRDFLNNKWFMEVDTPVLENTTGWADAAPFVTHHNALDMDVFLRISAWELWQKRLMVAWFEKIFELWRIFRNEWISQEHAQDYNQVEVYWAYEDYKAMMELVKEMYLYIIDTVYKKREFDIRWHNVDFNKDWYEIDYTQIIKEKTWIDIFKATDDEIINKLKELNISVDDYNRQRMIDYLWKSIRKTIPWPAFLINEPKFMSPLAKSDTNNPEITHRFHVIIAWSEVGNWYSELNDPIDQEERFQEQQKLRDSWDDEAQMEDKDFVEALKHGMPPTVWFWISERLFSFLEWKSIRDCQTFPLMKKIN